MENNNQDTNSKIFNQKIALNWPQEIINEFDDMAATYGIDFKDTGLIFIRGQLRQLIGKLLIYRDNILDVGIGNGLIFKHLKQKIPYVGIDISKKMLERSIEMAKKYNIPFQPVVGNIINLPFPDNYFTSTVCIDTLHHIPHNKIYQALNELIRVTKKNNGQILLEIKNKFNIALLLVYFYIARRGPLIMTPLNPISIMQYFKRHKFKIKVHFIGPGYWLAPFLLLDIRT